MAPRRRKADALPWWHARARYVLALLWAPAVWVAIVGGAARTLERIAAVETSVQSLRGDVARHDTELRDLRAHR